MKEIVPECGLPRYSVRPLPPYRHLPFQNAHPFMDADGHSYGEKLNPPESFGPPIGGIVMTISIVSICSIMLSGGKPMNVSSRSVLEPGVSLNVDCLSRG